MIYPHYQKFGAFILLIIKVISSYRKHCSLVKALAYKIVPLLPKPRDGLRWHILFHQISSLAAHAQEQPEAARRHFEEAFTRVTNAADPELLFNVVGFLACELGYFAEARICFEQNLAWGERRGHILQMAAANNGLGWLAQLEGNQPTAVSLHEQSLAVLEPLGEVGYESALFAHLFLGQAQRVLGHYETARDHFRAALGKAEWMGRWPLALEILTEAARLLADMAEPERGAAILTLAARHPATECAMRGKAAAYERELAAALPPDALAAARLEGERLDLADVMIKGMI